MKNKPNHIHFIGIAGSLMAPLAVEFKKQGYKVTGSDKAFYPPASTFLEENDIKIIPGFKSEKFKEIGKPDLAVLMSFYTEKNPEVIYLQKQKVEIIGLGQLLEKYFIKDDSIVVAGSAGKTTITSMIAWILETADQDPSIMSGGIMNNLNSGVKVGQSDWSVSEGDEFMNWHITNDYVFSKRSRLHYQKPKYVVFTGAEWDHYDQYPTEKDYHENFKTFLENISEEGFVVAKYGGRGIDKILNQIKVHTIFYVPPGEKFTETENAIYYWAEKIKYKTGSSSFEVWTKQRGDRQLVGHFDLNMLGAINIENALAAIAMTDQLGIAEEQIYKAIHQFKGVKRRQEVRADNKKAIVYDDYAHSPIKVKKLLASFRRHYPKNKIVLVYQPGNKDMKAIDEYTEDVFVDADKIILPHISSITKSSRNFNEFMQKRLRSFPEIKDKVVYLENDNEVIQILKEFLDEYSLGSGQKVLVVFAGQKGFRGMVEGLIEKI